MNARAAGRRADLAAAHGMAASVYDGRQEAFAAWCAEHSIPNAVAYSIDEAIKILSAWGALRVKIGGAP
jgi:hypothetical protein